jgi:hypothetical protein
VAGSSRRPPRQHRAPTPGDPSGTESGDRSAWRD